MVLDNKHVAEITKGGEVSHPPCKSDLLTAFIEPKTQTVVDGCVKPFPADAFGPRRTAQESVNECPVEGRFIGCYDVFTARPCGLIFFHPSPPKDYPKKKTLQKA
jgi:hypothetical protein